jgi:hypothetical protein
VDVAGIAVDSAGQTEIAGGAWSVSRYGTDGSPVEWTQVHTFKTSATTPLNISFGDVSALNSIALLAGGAGTFDAEIIASVNSTSTAADFAHYRWTCWRATGGYNYTTSPKVLVTGLVTSYITAVPSFALVSTTKPQVSFTPSNATTTTWTIRARILMGNGT